MSSPFFLLFAVAIGALLGLAIARKASATAARAAAGDAAEAKRADEALRGELAEQRLRGVRMEAEVAALRERTGAQESELARATARLEALHGELTAAREQLARAKAELAAEQSAAQDKLAVLMSAREEMADRFKALAAEILEEKSRRFTDTNRSNMDQLLTPLREKLGEFQLKVEALKEDGVAGRSELKTHIDGLRTLNERLSSEASSLVAALKGSSKTQGDWGEMLLEQMLEDCGLRRGHEYLVQESYTREDGTRARPDVIVHLPPVNGTAKHLVVDAKLSLSDYNAYCACTDDGARSTSLARHVASVREHLRGLAKKKYQMLYQLDSIDFVVMFVPIEPAYLLALSKDGRLWQEAWERDVLLVSPGSLYPVIRTVAHLWRQEQQNRNVQEIVDRGALLYDKLAAFAGDLAKVGAGLDTARDSYDKALSKLATGRGNVIGQAEKLKALGLKTSKSMPPEMLEALEEDLVRTLVDETDGAGQLAEGSLFE